MTMLRTENMAAVWLAERMLLKAFIAVITRDHEYGLRSLIHAFVQSQLFLSMKVDTP